MAEVSSALLKVLPNSASVLDAQLNRHFSVLVRQGQLFQSEWETDSSGKEVFRQTERIEWLMGVGENGIGGVVQRGNRLFEAPLTYYAKTRSWALSPGYEEADRGFSRPIEAECIVCHSGRPNPLGGATGEYGNSAFSELAIGCENCHGPGAAHIREMRAGAPKAAGSDHAIVNPAKLAPWLADNICMSCHQSGDARVLQPGRNAPDFVPGQPLDHTLAILMVPPTRASPPDSDHVQHYFSMTLSKCYRSSAAKMSCITCHDPHVQPSRAEAPAFFKKKCLTCHTESSCAISLAKRQEKAPPDSCIGCHMPKRNVAIIAHASLTNHRIVANAGEPFPDETFQLATKELPDLIHLDAIPGEADNPPPPLTLLQAYGQLGVDHREYLHRYFEVAEQLESSEPNNIYVLEALASRSLQQRTPEGDQSGMEYLRRAIELGSASPWDYEQFGGRLLRDQKFSEALACLQLGVQRAPYDPKLHALLAEAYVTTNRPEEAASTLRHALEVFPQMDFLRQLLRELEEANIQQEGTGHP